MQASVSRMTGPAIRTVGGRSSSALVLRAPSAAARRTPGLAPLASVRHAGGSATLEEVLSAAKEEEKQEAEKNPAKSTSSTPSSKEDSARSQRGVMWFANIYPTKAFKLDFRQAFTHMNHETTIPKLLQGLEGVEITKILPREREGGAFVYFQASPQFVRQAAKKLAEEDEGAKKQFMKKEDVLATVCSGISQYLKTHDYQAFLTDHPVRAHRVHGEPYLEDLQSRFPSSRLRIQVNPPDALNEEQIFDLCRRYGALQDIEKLPDNKGYSVSFNFTAAAVAARNCLHRAKVDPAAAARLGTVSSQVSTFRPGKVEDLTTLPEVTIQFEPFVGKWVREFITNNARYTIPLIAALFLGTTVFIWDPLRNFSIQVRLAALYGLQKEDETHPDHQLQHLGGLWGLFVHALQYYNKATDSLYKAAARFQRPSEKSLLQQFWGDRQEEVNEFRRWLNDPQDRVLLLTGHRGAGQATLVREVMGIDAIYIDVASMLEAGGAVDDSIFLRHLCRSVGYWPAQGMDRQMTALLDLMLPGSGKLSRENEVLVAAQRVFSSTTGALIAWRNRWLRKSSDPSVLPPLPLIIIDGFTAENKARREGFFETIVTWAAYVSEHQLARVLFTADSSFAEPAMLSALGNRPERLDVQELTDADTTVVRSVLEQHFGGTFDLSEEELATIGGRYRDITTLVAMIHDGSDPKEAVGRLVDGAEKIVRNLLMRGQHGVKWTRPQLWRAVKLLANTTGSDASVPYDVFIYNVFRGDEIALQSMKESGLITVTARPRGMFETNPDKTVSSQERAARGYKVLPGSPLFAEVYWRLAHHTGLAAVLDLEVAKEDIKRETATLEAYEADLVRLQEVDDVKLYKSRGLKDPNEALRKRKEQLLELILEQHKKLEGYHKARRDALHTLNQRKEKFNAAVRQEREAAARAARAKAELEAYRAAAESAVQARGLLGMAANWLTLGLATRWNWV
mmetsp:Transcript_96646/g.202003  ORF Transcript_96646/g.202003 Transcript_96646/m.202003 type:complete len:964 (-) Transcript_96646:327-3218(-)